MMESMKILCLTIVLIGCHSEAISASNPAADPLERHVEADQVLKKLFRRSEHDYDRCSEAYMCVTSTDTRVVSGDVYDGLTFNMSGFSQVCRDAKEYLICYNKAALEYECGPQSSMFAAMATLTQKYLCDGSPEMESVLECFNRRHVQTLVFGEFKEYLGRSGACHDMTSEARSEFMCRIQRGYYSEIMSGIGEECGSAEFTFLCDIFSDIMTGPLMENFFRFENCGADAFSRCRYAEFYNWSDLK